jgi:hypothetical protein
MNKDMNWKLRKAFTGNNTSDVQTINGYIAAGEDNDFSVEVSPVGKEYPAPLVVPRTNLVVTSEYAGGLGWFISSNYSVTNNAAISPEGVQNAFELTTSSTPGNIRAIVSVSPFTEYTFSFYVKRGTATELKYSVYDLTNNSDIVASTSYYSQTSSTEWKRLEVTFTTPAGCTSAGVYLDRDSQSNGTAFFYGIQCEQGSYATEYIPTNGAAVTRSWDSFSRVQNQVPGICNGIHTHTGAASGGGIAATTLTGTGSGGKFKYEFDTLGKLTLIEAMTHENLLLQSNTFDTTWSVFGSVMSSQAGYDGTNDASLLSKSASNGRVDQTLTASGLQTLSIYAKANTATWLKLQAYDGSLYRTTSFNLSGDGVIGNEYNLTDANILSLGNGWYRCSIIFSGPTQKVYVYPAGGDNDTTQTSGSIYIQDAQLETGDTATDYVETTTTPAVRMGYVVTENGTPAMQFDGSDDYLQTPAISALNTDLQSSFIVVTDDSGDISLRFAWRSSYTSGAAGLSNVLTSVFKSNVFGFHARASNGTYQGVSNALPTNQGLISTAWNASDVVSGKLNGVDFTTNNDTGADAVPIGHNFTRIGSDSSSTQYFWQGTMQEIIFYPSDETSNGTNIETNINDYYDIYS